MGNIALQVSGLSKSFPGVTVLKDVDLTVEAGSVHALMGENGAGKSTLMKILIGLHQPDAGEILFKGQYVSIANPHAALRLGISMIHQELMPFRNLTVAENICMGREPTRGFGGWLDKPAMNREAEALLQRLGITLAPTRRMKTLSVAEMQTVEIAKALAYNADVIIMDEPTSAISQREVEALFEVIRGLKQRGVAIIYISHKMDEIFRIADVVTVLRDGRHIGTRAIGELDERTLITWMVGRELGAAAPATISQSTDTVLEVRDLTKPGRFRGVNFSVRRGEVLGLAGLLGAGRTDVAHAIFGLAPADSGEIYIHGQPVRIRRPSDAIAKGIALVSEDRKEYGLALQMSVKHNITLASLAKYCRAGVVDRSAENAAADGQISALAIKTGDRQQAVGLLSGGNQQKVVIAKALLSDPDILILDEPTRGIDIGAKADVYAIIARLASEGKAIVLISSELPELLALSHRILVMREGEISAELDPRFTTQEEILKFAMGGLE